ncbi:aldose epimerase family protein [Salinimicrobium xinjiangense]|uniref:aldose epimerase family protein n=1 Tax=Salinimicrobium xinjiangense TaxID=438596 RepID=UPI00041F2EAB|nr:hypothetical protein [Salinimicrobium xinjiangense]
MGGKREGCVRDPEVREALEVVVLKNTHGTILKILNFGASVFSLELNGKTNVVVGPKNPKDYLTEAYFAEGKHFGASLGRHAGRISNENF